MIKAVSYLAAKRRKKLPLNRGKICGQFAVWLLAHYKSIIFQI